MPIGTLMAAPGTRGAILEFLGLEGVANQSVEKLPPVSPRGKLVLGSSVSLKEARERAGFEVLVPQALGKPDEIYVLPDFPPGGMVSLVYGSSQRPRLLLTQFEGTVSDVVFRRMTSGRNIVAVDVGGERGYWLDGEPRFFRYLDARGESHNEMVRLAGNVLIWERGPLTLRLEAEASRAEALGIAGSLRAA